ncbi:c-type cytochrome [Zoogloea sp.]|uniref:c-type cytochrome n=1 Tax=Zoogloea sp. TaxID=49181 RepID=UPI002613C9E6|nr:c-type cytochrome [Zoogloea sp.]MDD3353070.1 cytochrome C [Zoogloea sp.]
MPRSSFLLRQLSFLTRLALFLPGAAGATSLQPDDVALLAGTCFNCHGTNGRSTTAIPGLHGQPEARLRTRMQDFRAGSTAGTTVMTRLMKGYDEVQIDALARWFAQAGDRP